MSFDGIVTKSIVAEMQKKILGGKIEKVYQPEKEQLYFQIHAHGGKYNLFMSSESNHAAIYLTNKKPLNPPEPLAFCMLLRKHLQNGRISEIKQRGTERIVDFFIETVNEMGFNVNKKLTVEVMGKHSNIMLIDNESDKIIDSIKRVSADINRYRQIFPSQKYVAPPSQDKLPFEKINYQTFISSFIDNSKTIQKGYDFAGIDSTDTLIHVDGFSKILMNHFQGFSPNISKEIATRYLHYQENLSNIFNEIDANTQKNNFGALYIGADDIPKEFHIIKLKTFSRDLKEITFDSPSEMVGYFFENRAVSNTLKQKSSDLLQVTNTHLNKMRLKKQRLSEDLDSAMKMDKYKLYGELITTFIHEIENGSNSVKLLNYYDNSYVNITLDPLLSPAANAQKYFKKYTKAKTAKIEKARQLNETDAEIAYLESVLEYIESANNITQIDNIRLELTECGYLKKRNKSAKKIKQKQEPYRYVTSDGFLLMAGHNNNENDFLTLKIAKNKDIWFHTKDIPGSHVVLFPEGKQITETAIFEAAALAAWHSKGRASENVPVDYTFIKNVKKPSGAKPGMVIFTDNKTIYVNPKEAELLKK